MNWKMKSRIFSFLERIPFGAAAHKALQKYGTGRYFETLDDETFSAYNYHVEQFVRRSPAGTAMEFGSGRNLLVPLLLSNAGAKAIYCYDLTRHATLDQINNMIGQLAQRLGGEWPTVEDFSDLAAKYHIQYFAPGDARDTALPAGSVDMIYSTSTLEHIPESSIRQILKECLRIVKPEGFFGFIIDYHDHYATADPEIGMFNFYRFSERDWKKYNPDIHYQNRLRHSDYIRIFEECGLYPEVADAIKPEWAARDAKLVPINPAFSSYSTDDLKTANGFFILRKTGD